MESLKVVLERISLPYKSESTEYIVAAETKMNQKKNSAVPVLGVRTRCAKTAEKNNETNNSDQKLVDKNIVVAAKRTRRQNSIENKARTSKSDGESVGKQIR